MPSKKAKGEEEPVKPLSFYVKDRLELTKQLFSCLKSKQIKSRLPKNIQNKSMERIQQICFDEILGISSKRLLSIINNTKCPADTESDSDIEHISLSEISSDDDISVVATIADKQAGTSKSQTGEQTEKGPNEPKTMLELIELEARARAIRSQLALEPITKIELDDTEDEEVPEESPVTGPVASIVNAQPSKRKSSESSKKSTQTAKKSLDAAKSSDNAKESNSSKSTGESTKKPSEVAKKTTEAVKRTSEITKKDASKSTETSKKPSTSSNDKSKSRSERNIRPRKSPSPAPQPATITRRVVVLKRSNHAELTITAPAPKTSVPPVKLKRNFSKTPSDTNISKTSENISPKTSETSIVSETPKEIETKIEETMTESRSSSPDIITMEQNISTYFISDSDDDEPPAKRKSTEKGRQKEKNTPEKVPQKSLDDAKSSNENEKNQEQSKSPSIEVSKDVAKSSKENSESTEGIKSSSIEEKTSDVVSKSAQESSQIEVEIATEETEPGEVIDSPVLQSQKEQSLDGDDDNVVNLMSDTEIDPSDKEDDDIDTLTKESSMPDKTELEKPKEVSQSNDSDDDIVEILHSEDDLKQGESSTKNPEDSETWNQRYLRSSTVKSVLETTKLASKLRGKLAANKKSQKESIQKKKNADKEKQKELTEKISKLEEGSLEQFEGLRESSNSSV